MNLQQYADPRHLETEELLALLPLLLAQTYIVTGAF
jgi:hypothetical protein